MILDNFVVFEGCDGAGTSTQLHILCNNLKNFRKNGDDIKIFKTFEPSNGPIGILIREFLQNSAKIRPETRAFLFAADRYEHLFGKNGILDNCRNGKLTICDRYVLSSMVYQGIECGPELPELLNKCFPTPELLIYFDIDVDIAISRIFKRKGVREIYEYRDFQKNVSLKYKELLLECEKLGSRVEVIDASDSVENVSEQVLNVVKKMPIFDE